MVKSRMEDSSLPNRLRRNRRCRLRRSRNKGYHQRLSPKAITKGYHQRLSPKAITKGYHQRLSPKAITKGYHQRLSPKAITKGGKGGGFFSSRLCREEDSSLSDKVGWRGLAKQDESSILRRWARLFSQRKEGSCEARRIIDPSTMGSSLL